MAAIPWVADDPNLWERVTIAGVTFTGIAWVAGHKGHRVDQKNSPGREGAVFTSLGFDPAQVGVILTLVTRDDWKSFQGIVPLLRAAKGHAPKPVAVFHPSLAVYRIRNLYVLDLGLPRKAHGAPDILEVELRMAEYVPPRVAKVKTAKGAASSAATAATAASSVPAHDQPPYTAAQQQAAQQRIDEALYTTEGNQLGLAAMLPPTGPTIGPLAPPSVTDGGT